MNEENKSTENSVDNSVEKENVTNEKKSNSDVMKKLAIGLGAFVVLVGLMFIPIKSRTTVGRLFDLVGAHKLAMGVDAMVNGQNNLSNLASHVDVTSEESFVNSWDKVKESDLKFEAVSMKSNFVAYPGNEEYSDSLRAGGAMDLNVSLKDQKASGNINFNVDAQLSKVSENYQDMESSFSVLGAIDNERAYFKAEEGKVKFQGMNMSFSLDDWYSSEDFGLTDEQKGALNEIAKLVTELTEIRLSQVMSDETGRQFMTASHNLYGSKIEVGGIKKVEFGQGEDKVTKKVREIVFEEENFDEYGDVMKSFGEEMFDGVDMLVNDKVFQEFYKNDHYDWVVKIAPQIATLTDNDKLNEEISKEDYEKAVDENIKDFNENKDEIREEFLSEIDKTIEIENPVIDAIESVNFAMYLEPGTNNYYGYKYVIKFKLPEDMLAEIEMNNAEIYSIVKDGIIVEVEAYDMRLNERVEPVSIPENVKPFEEFIKAMESDQGTASFFNSLEAMMDSLMGTQTYESQIYEDEMTGAWLYYDAMTDMNYEVYESQDGKSLLYLDPMTNEYYEIPQEVMMKAFSQAAQEVQTDMTAEEQAELEKMITN